MEKASFRRCITCTKRLVNERNNSSFLTQNNLQESNKNKMLFSSECAAQDQTRDLVLPQLNGAASPFQLLEFLCGVPLPWVCQEQRVPVASN